MKSLLGFFLFCFFFASFGAAQTVFDHFTGTSLNKKLWWPYGEVSARSFGKSQMKMSLSSNQQSGMISMEAMKGDFDFVLDFSQFSAPGSNNLDAEFELSVMNAEGPIGVENHLGVSIEGAGRGIQFSTYSEQAGKFHGFAKRATTATAGELRIRRYTLQSKVWIAALVRPRGQKSWTVLRTWPNWFPNLVYIKIQASTAKTNSLSVQSDKLSYFVATRVASPMNYGRSCHSLSSRAYGIPSLGNSNYGILVWGGKKLGLTPLLTLLGLKKLSVDLSALGAPGCFLYASPDLILLLPSLDKMGWGFAKLPIPNTPSLRGLRIYHQQLVISSQNRLQLLFSNGVETILR